MQNDTIIESTERFQARLHRLEGSSYTSLKALRHVRFYTGKESNGVCTIHHVQADPFAPPSHMSVRVQLPFLSTVVYSNDPAEIRNVACCDYLLRKAVNVSKNIQSMNLQIPSQHVLQRSAIELDTNHGLILRGTVSLPAFGRGIDSRGCYRALVESTQQIVHAFLQVDPKKLEAYISNVVDQDELRASLESHNLCAFIANGAVLPRACGDSDLPMDVTTGSLVKFLSPETLKYRIKLPSGREVEGMGIRKGITIITGGGFHGKSTLLRALEVGVFNHTVGDGREFVVTDETAVKIRAEDKRVATSVDIGYFIHTLPGGSGASPRNAHFTTTNASGSTSQACNSVEAIEAGSKCLLIDEDTSATNLLVRDELVTKLVETEPIIPYVARAREMFTQHGISTLLVVGSNGQFLRVADSVIGMINYHVHDLTMKSAELCQSFPSLSPLPTLPDAAGRSALSIWENCRTVDVTKTFSFFEHGRRNRIRANADRIDMVDESINMELVEQLVEKGQSNYIAEALCYIASQFGAQRLSVARIAHIILHIRNASPANPFSSFAPGFSSRARPYEVIAALNRLKSLTIRRGK
ncbi:ATPase of the ABC class-like protein [Perkinsela sp. CCAP 1560/4]|nr:ATPase of the ABC class-like protein [Perkinsela sp. CCAP 1560/4]|eukprot:KNH05014.1 ATPase of the ABC class-like protein [Perkinsela sp. CCAP 1560/4]